MRLVLVSPPPQLLDPAALARFVGRVLIVTGELDRVAPPEALGALAESARRGHFTVIPGCDHFFGVGLAELGREVSGWLVGSSR
jgi:pimeloyl-ACP methyl ester carboxylesterase